MPVYLIVEIARIHDAAAYDTTSSGSRQVGGRVVRGGPVIALAGGDRRVVILEFDTFEAMGTFVTSPEYRALAPLREAATETRAIALEGHRSFEPKP
jgi:uncharacterized protein (DUF1330 family)